ncbi:hypothetical protein B5V03_08255 [Bradyrhizobium betae]|uniref:Uncharacterized protein n=1 Tax=Bradyrhizobium betae TaxID=244734 RepID=A0A4V1P748_9BRAD|nr:hypothetical protein B5V03_08255 [Bradyrhizobium betae]
MPTCATWTATRSARCTGWRTDVKPREGGASSTPRPLDSSLPSLEHWIARSSRAMTTENVARGSPHLVIAGVAKQSRLPLRKDSGLLRYARNDGGKPHSVSCGAR